jgi:hypothetical protein
MRKRDGSKEVVASVKDSFGRTIVLERGRWEHIVKYADRDMEGRELALMRVVEDADKRKDGKRPGTQVLYKDGLGGRARWLAVVVEYHGLQGRVLTAYPLSQEPQTDR